MNRALRAVTRTGVPLVITGADAPLAVIEAVQKATAGPVQILDGRDGSPQDAPSPHASTWVVLLACNLSPAARAQTEQWVEEASRLCVALVAVTPDVALPAAARGLFPAQMAARAVLNPPTEAA